MKQEITGVKNNNAFFKVSFPEGLKGSPSIEFNGLDFDLNGDSMVYGAVMACSNYLASEVDRMKSLPQFECEVSDLTDDNGVINASIKNKVITKE